MSNENNAKNDNIFETFQSIFGEAKVTRKPYAIDGKKVTFGRWIQTEDMKDTPIVWDVISEKDGGYLCLLSRYILDLVDYDKCDEFADSIGVSINSKNYKDSGIRKYLNGYFYNTAFNENEKKSIAKVKIDNSKESVLNPNNLNFCEKTEEYVYLLSAKEAYDVFKEDRSRMAIGTKLIGSDYTAWWLRSIYGDNNGFAYGVVSQEGKVSYVKEKTLIEKGKTATGKEEFFKKDYGIRPVVWIKK